MCVAALSIKVTKETEGCAQRWVRVAIASWQTDFNKS